MSDMDNIFGNPSKNPRGANWPEQRLDALRRDKKACRNCGAKRRKKKRNQPAVVLHVHHIKPMRCFSSPGKANGLRNLITLCGPCHAAAEQKARANSKYKTHPDYIAPQSFHGAGWPAQRAAALRRDLNNCQKCGKHADKGLHVHHIVPAFVYHHMANGNASIRTPESHAGANALSNLITLCHRCHLRCEQSTKIAYPRITKSPYGFAASSWCHNLRLRLYRERHAGKLLSFYDPEIDHACNAVFLDLEGQRFAAEEKVAKQFPGCLCIVDTSKLHERAQRVQAACASRHWDSCRTPTVQRLWIRA